jgi:hypothetical protein
MFEPLVENALNRIAKNKNKYDIRLVRITIGRYRLNAEKFHGYTKYLIHKEANRVERQLMYLLEE